MRRFARPPGTVPSPCPVALHPWLLLSSSCLSCLPHCCPALPKFCPCTGPAPGPSPQLPVFPVILSRAWILDLQGNVVEGGDVTGALCISQAWPGMARTIYGDHNRFIDSYFRTFPGEQAAGLSTHRSSLSTFGASSSLPPEKSLLFTRRLVSKTPCFPEASCMCC